MLLSLISCLVLHATPLSGHGPLLDLLSVGRLAGRLGARRLGARRAVAEVSCGAVETVRVHELGPGRAVLGAEERRVRRKVLRAGEERGVRVRVRVRVRDRVWVRVIGL